MTTVRLACGRAGTLFYEPEGLLLRSCLIPVHPSHSEHLLTFQLGYLGAGAITVHIALDGESDRRPTKPSVATVLLRGTDAAEDDAETVHHRVPGVWLTYVSVLDTRVCYRYTVWGQPGASGDDLRGELVTEISGTMPLLTATTRASATRQPIPEAIRFLPVMDWDQADGRSSFPLPECDPRRADAAGQERLTTLARASAAGHYRAGAPVRNSQASLHVVPRTPAG